MYNESTGRPDNGQRIAYRPKGVPGTFERYAFHTDQEDEIRICRQADGSDAGSVKKLAEIEWKALPVPERMTMDEAIKGPDDAGETPIA